ncbi:hypothetical protein EYR36_001685 [Pleurotus pulmonarius]|nr:hypothetical protein EYR36_008372 [Pleurotus pulmonarius]KAF4579865.1 hypothetical protein EYR36_001685 [Pleurotus pulmonarius]
MAVGMVVPSSPSPSLSMPSLQSSPSLRRSPRIHPRHALTSVAADVAALSIQVRKRHPVLADTPTPSSSSVASSSSSLATPPTTPNVGPRKRQRRPSQFLASNAEAPSTPTPTRCTSKHQLLTPRSIRATKRQRTSPSPSSMQLRRTTAVDSGRKGKKKATPKAEAITTPSTSSMSSLKRKGKEKLTDWIPLELSPPTPAAGGRRSRRSENSTPVVLGEPRPLGLGMATRSASRKREMGLAPPVSSGSSPPSSPRLKPSLSIHLMSPLSPLSSAPPSPLSTPPTSPVRDDDMDVDVPNSRPGDVEMSTNNDECMECEPSNANPEDTSSTPSPPMSLLSPEPATSSATTPCPQPLQPPQPRSRSSTSPPSRLQELKFDDTEIAQHAEPPRIIVLEEHVGQPEISSNNAEMLYESPGSDENSNIYRSDSNTTSTSASSVGYGFEMDASDSMEGGSYYDDYSHTRDGGDSRGYSDGYDCNGYGGSCAPQQPRIEKGDGVWKVACSWRVWEIQRRYTPDTIRAVVAQQANDYYATHGGLDTTNAGVNGHRRKRSEEDNILGSAITRKDGSQCDSSVQDATQDDTRSQKESANGVVTGGKWGGNGAFGDDGLAYMLGYSFEDEDEDSDDSDEDDDGECAPVEAGDCSENELKWELVERDGQAVKTEEAGGGEKKLIIQTLHLGAATRDVAEEKPSTVDSSLISPSIELLPANSVQSQPDAGLPSDAIMSTPAFSPQSYPEPLTTIAIPQLPSPAPITTSPPKENELSFPSAPSPAQPSLSPSFTSFPSSPTALHLPFPPPRLSSIRVGLLRSMDIDDWGGEDEPLSSGGPGERGSAGRARRRPGWIGRGTPVDRRRRAEWANSWSPLSMKGKGRLGEEMDRMDGMPGALSIAMGMGPGMGVHASPPYEDPKSWNEFLRSLDMGNAPTMSAPRQDGMDIGLDAGVTQQLSMPFSPAPNVPSPPSFSPSPSPSPTLLSPTSVFPPASNPINGLNQNTLFVPPVPSGSPAPFQSALDLNFGRNGEGMALGNGGDVGSMNGMNMGVNMGLVFLQTTRLAFRRPQALTTVTVINCHSASMAFKPYGPQYYPGFVMNESKLFFEAEQSDLPRQKTNYCLHVDGMALMKQYGLKLIREWKMPMEIRPVWVGDRRCMYAWLLPRNHGTTLFLDADFQARLADFKKIARIPGPPDEQPRWLALHTSDIPRTFVKGQRWADEKYRSQSIQETPMYTTSCANCDLFDPPEYIEGDEDDDDFSEDGDEEGSDPDAEEDSEDEKDEDGDAGAEDKGVTPPAKSPV